MTKVMLITGASSGIGEATARRLAREPEASLVLVARREERLSQLAAELGERRVSYVAADLLDEDAPQRIREHVLEHHGSLHLLVNNAGAAWRARFAEGGYENVRRTMAINFDAQLRLTEACATAARHPRRPPSSTSPPPPGASRRRLRRLQRLQVRPRRLVRRAVGRGAPARRTRGTRVARLISRRASPSPS